MKIDGKEYKLEEINHESHHYPGVDIGEDFNLFEGEIYKTYYKCPLCGKGQIIYVDEDTPGDRDHYTIFKCEHCNPGGLVYTPVDSLYAHPDFRKRTPEEVAIAAAEKWGHMTKGFMPEYYSAKDYKKVCNENQNLREQKMTMLSYIEDKEALFDFLYSEIEDDDEWYLHDDIEDILAKLGITFNMGEKYYSFEDQFYCDCSYDDSPIYQIIKILGENIIKSKEEEIISIIKEAIEKTESEWNEYSDDEVSIFFGENLYK